MTQEEKDLLQKDLCARLPYRVIGEYSWKGLKPYNRELTGNLYDELNSSWSSTENSKFVPYLFPLSSMTAEQKIECFKGTPLEINKYRYIVVKDDLFGNSQYTDLEIYLEVIDWCNKNRFDYRGLIEKGLAIDATGLNIY